MPAETTPTPLDRFGKSDAIVVSILTLIGLILRTWNLGRLGLTHYDEGIYALTGLWVQSPRPGAEFAGLVSYSPPGFVILVGIAYGLLGVSDLAAVAVSQLLGTLTIPAVAWLGWRTFGRSAGLVASALAATSGPHVSFSRLALTDASFLLVWVGVLGLGQRFLERSGPSRALLLGAGVGLLQMFKYHGYLVGLIVAVTALIPVRTRGDRPGRMFGIRATLGWGILAALVAAAVVFPWYDFVDRNGGYGRLLAHQRSYLGGLGSWWPHLLTQWRQSRALAGAVGWGLASGMVVLGLVVIRSEQPRTPGRLLWGLMLASVATLVPESTWWAGLAALPSAIGRTTPSRTLLGVAWVVLAILTPFYHPYARLWLPIEALGWLGWGALLSRFSIGTCPVDRPARVSIAGLGGVVLAVHLGLVGVSPRLAGGLDPTDGLRGTIDRFVTSIPPGEPGVAVLSRPGVLFYLRGRVAPMRVADPSGFAEISGRARFGIYDAGLGDVAGPEGGLPAIVRERWEVVLEESTPLSLPALLDLDPGTASRPDPGRGARSVRVWLLRSRFRTGRP